METKLRKIYESPIDPGSYGGLNRLYDSAKAKHINVTRGQVSKFLRSHRGYTLHRPYRKHFIRNPTIVSGIDAQWQADLVDMQSLSRSNKGVRYILTVIDCFSRFAWAIPLKKKTAAEIIRAFSHIFSRYNRSPKKLQTDKGKEFLNKPFQTFLKERHVHHFTTENETKAALVERFNRTLKTRMWTFFTTKGTDEYLKVLEDLVDGYNHSIHRSIGMRPIDVKKKDEEKLFQKLYATTLASSKSSIKYGPYVRISKAKNIFDKGYRANWSGEIYKVRNHLSQSKKPLMNLQDLKEPPEVIQGRFYPEEVQTVEYDSNSLQPIERIIRSRVTNGRKEFLVKWLDFPSSMNSWVEEREMRNTI